MAKNGFYVYREQYKAQCKMHLNVHVSTGQRTPPTGKSSSHVPWVYLKLLVRSSGRRVHLQFVCPRQVFLSAPMDIEEAWEVIESIAFFTDSWSNTFTRGRMFWAMCLLEVSILSNAITWGCWLSTLHSD